MYLGNWGNNDRIYVYHILVPNDGFPLWKAQSIKHTASLKDLYTDVEKNVEYDRTERAFSEKYESLAKIPLEKACQGDKIEGKDWDIIIDFVLLQFVRTPAFYLWIIDRGKEIIPPTLDTIADTLSELKSPPDISKIEAFNGVNLPLKIEKVKDNPKEDTIDLEIKTIIGKNTWLLSIDALMDKKSLVRKQFHALKWSILTADENDSWPTCDNPVIICDYFDGRVQRVSLKDGLGGKNRAIIFPISPQKALFGEVHRTIRWRETANSVLCKSIKKAICDNAFRYIYSNVADSDVWAFRKRIVDLALFTKVKNEFDNWYENYKLSEEAFLE